MTSQSLSDATRSLVAQTDVPISFPHSLEVNNLTPAQASVTSSPSPTSTATDCPKCSHPSLGVGQGFGIGFGVGLVLTVLVIAGLYIRARRGMVKDTLRGMVDSVRHKIAAGGHHQSNTLQRRNTKRERHNLTSSLPPVMRRSESITIFNSLDDLPQPIAHESLRLEISGLETAIKNFVDNYFHNKPVSETAFDESSLVSLAAEGSFGEPWAPALANIDTRDLAIRCFIAQVIFRCMDLDKDISLSILPPSIISSYSQIMASEGARSQRYLLAIWRQTTAYLLRETTPGRITKNDPRLENIRSVASAIVEAMGPIRNHKQQERCHEVLEDIVGDAAVLALRLFSQEDEWNADWTARKSGFLVFPALRMASQNPRTGVRATSKVAQAVVEPIPTQRMRI